MTATELLEREYGQDEMAMELVKEFREDLNMTDQEIYDFLESFF